jgi:predicted HTH transcriptional regulator
MPNGASAALSELAAARLQALVDNGMREGRQLDFKERLPGNSDTDRREFAADVSSFANAAGGDLIFGIAERRDRDGRATGTGQIVGLPDFNFDQARLRLESMIRTGIEPRLAVQFAEVQRDAEPPCLVIRIPKGWSGLYMVTAGGLNAFYGRHSAGRYLLDVRDIGLGFR